MDARKDGQNASTCPYAAMTVHKRFIIIRFYLLITYITYINHYFK